MSLWIGWLCKFFHQRPSGSNGQRCLFFVECFSPLGMEDMKIKDGQVTASSTYHLHKPFYGRLNLVSFYDDPQRTAWCADEDDKEPYLTVDLREEKTLSGVALQGASLEDNYVTSFKLCYSQNGRTFQCVTEDLTGEVRRIFCLFIMLWIWTKSTWRLCQCNCILKISFRFLFLSLFIIS